MAAWGSRQVRAGSIPSADGAAVCAGRIHLARSAFEDESEPLANQQRPGAFAARYDGHSEHTGGMPQVASTDTLRSSLLLCFACLGGKRGLPGHVQKLTVGCSVLPADFRDGVVRRGREP